MGTRENQRDTRAKRSITSPSYGTTTWFVLVFCGLLIAADLNLKKVSLKGQDFFLYEQSGVVYYLGLTEPTGEDLQVISQWLQLPIVQLLYYGPVEYREILEKKLNDLGVLVGIGDFLLVRVEVSQDLCHYEISCRGCHYSETVNAESFSESLHRVLTDIFGKIQKPTEGYLVEIGDQVLITKTAVQKPVQFIFQKKVHSVVMRGKSLLLEEGFYNFYGRTVYVDRDMKIEEPVFFVENASMVYKTNNGFVTYENGKIIFPDGRSFYAEEPSDVIDDKLVAKMINVKVDGLPVSATVLGRHNELLILANGVIVPLDQSWAMKVSGPVLEWSVEGDRLYVLDISGYLRAIDLKRRKLLWEKRFAGAWGVSARLNRVYLGVENKLLVMDESGQIISQEPCSDFGVWKEGIITLKSPQEGYVIRSYIGLAVWNGSQVILYIDEPRSFEDVLRIRFFDWGCVVATTKGCWVIER
ncbi:MAG: hypothetical protein WHT65_02090 [Pseudothermotoga sp.]